MQTYPIGKGEIRIATVDFDMIVPAGVTISSATAVVEDLNGTTQSAGWTLGSPSISGTDVTVTVSPGSGVTAGTYQLEVRAVLSNGEAVHNRDEAGYAMRLVVRE